MLKAKRKKLQADSIHRKGRKLVVKKTSDKVVKRGKKKEELNLEIGQPIY